MYWYFSRYSIVVLENIHRYIDEGYTAEVAAELGRNEIGMAAIAMTLCDIVVFLPIAFMESSTGQFFKQIWVNNSFCYFDVFDCVLYINTYDGF